MAGIDRIKEAILGEAKAKVDTILSEAREAADQVRESARSEAETARNEAADKAAKNTADYQQRIQSQIGLRGRQTVLKAKQEMIAEVLEEAYQKLVSAPDEDYFKMVLALAEKNVQPGNGEILFNKKDLARLPKDLEASLGRIAAGKGGTLKVGKEAVDIDSGFILRYRPEETAPEEAAVPGSTYGAVEQNCSLRSLMAEKKDELSDLVNQNLF